MKSLFLICALFVTEVAGADVYKCKSENGYQYQEAPCKNTGEKVELKNQSITGDSDAANIPPDIRNKFEQSVSVGKISVGMTKGMVTRAWGRPTKVNLTVGSYGRHEQWVYTHSNYVYIENGLVTAIQSHE